MNADSAYNTGIDVLVDTMLNCLHAMPDLDEIRRANDYAGPALIFVAASEVASALSTEWLRADVAANAAANDDDDDDDDIAELRDHKARLDAMTPEQREEQRKAVDRDDAENEATHVRQVKTLATTMLDCINTIDLDRSFGDFPTVAIVLIFEAAFAAVAKLPDPSPHMQSNMRAVFDILQYHLTRMDIEHPRPLLHHRPD